MTNKKLGLPSALAAGVGLIVATSCLVTLSQGVGIAGNGFIIAMAIACGLNILVAFSFAEMNSLMPITGGLGQYTLVAFGPFVSIIAVIGGYLICNIFAASSESAMIGLVVSSVFLPNVNPLFISYIVIAALFLINIFGIKSYARTQLITTAIMIGSMLALGIIGLLKVGSGEVVAQTTGAFNPMGLSVISLTALAFWLFIGVEFVTPLTKNMKNAERNIPLGMILALIILLVVQSVMSFAISNYVPYDVLQTSNQPHMEFARLMLGSFGTYWMGIISIGAVVSTLNTVFAGVSRMLMGLAEGGMLPKVFAKKNRFGVPYVSLTVLVGCMLIVLSTGITSSEDMIRFILTGCLFWMISYIIAHSNVLILRKKYPNVKRSFSVKLFGLPQIVGIIGMVYMIVNIINEPVLRTQIYTLAGIVLAVLIIYSFIWVKFIMKKGLFETSTIEEVIAQDKDADDDDSNDNSEVKMNPAYEN